jgi:hypothetical protein
METTALKMFESTVKIENDQVFVKPLCDFFQITYDNQAVKIKNDPILSKSAGKKPLKMLFGDNHPRLYLDKKGFIRWIQIINPSIIREDLRESFIKYQALIFDFFYGSAEQEDQIRKLVGKNQDIDEQLRELARQKRQVRKQLTQALNERYQYSINFNEQPAIAES